MSAPAASSDAAVVTDRAEPGPDLRDPGLERPDRNSALALAVCLFLCAPVDTLIPAAGLDNSWQLTLNLIRPDGLRFGRDVYFTYGPWGFLDVPTATSRINVAGALLFAAFAFGAAWWALRLALRRVLPMRWAEPVATALLVLIVPTRAASSVLVVAVALAAFATVSSGAGPAPIAPTTPTTPRGPAPSVRPDGWLVRLLPATGAALAAFVLQIKFSEGGFLILVVAAAALFAPTRRLRGVIEAVVAFVVVTVIAWLGAGQSLGDYQRWLGHSVEISQGYTEAMALEVKPYVLRYVLIVALILVLIGLAVGWARVTCRRVAVGVILIAAILVFFGFREGTGRHDSGHEAFYYLFALPVVVWFLSVLRTPAPRAALVAAVVLLGLNNWSFVNPTTALHRWDRSVEIATDPDYQTATLTAARKGIRAVDQVSPALIAAAQGHPVAIDGYELALLWAYGLGGPPPPVFQSYSAYTADLDELNADWLRDTPADQRILRPPVTTFDGRNTLWDPPRYVLTELCLTRVVATSAHWLLLGRSTDRCGRPQALETVHVGAGASVAVPSVGPDQILVASFRTDTTNPFVALGRTLDKSFHPLKADTGAGRFRVPRALAGQPLVLSVPTRVGWPAQFGGGTRYPRLGFSEAGTIHFEAITVS